MRLQLGCGSGPVVGHRELDTGSRRALQGTDVGICDFIQQLTVPWGIPRQIGDPVE
jgi:hypothetical protein